MGRARAWGVGCAIVAALAALVAAVAVAFTGWAVWSRWLDRGTATCSAWCDDELGFECGVVPTLHVGGREVVVEDTFERSADVTAEVKPGDTLRCAAGTSGPRPVTCELRVGTRTLAHATAPGRVVCAGVAPR